IERLGELVARHRTFRQACEDRVTQRHFANPPSCLTLCVKVHMRQCAYCAVHPNDQRCVDADGRPLMTMSGLDKWYGYMRSHDTATLWDLLHPYAVLESPVVDTPQRGRDMSFKYLSSAEKVL